MIDDHAVFIGIVRAKKRVDYPLAPGKHFFVVIGESADFMTADVTSGKTYYALVTPRIGAWKARFSLRPLHQVELGTDQATKWIGACTDAPKQAKDDAWAASNRQSVEVKRAKYYPEWMRKPDAERPALAPEDGS